MKFVQCLAGMAIALSSAAPAAVPDGVSLEAEAQGDTVLIPFNPPLGRKLTYRMSRIKEKQGEKSETPIELTLEFARDGNDYLMTVVHLLPPALRDIHHPGLAIMKRPLVFRLDESGAPIGVKDEEEYWAGVAETFQSMPGAKDDPEAGDMFARMIQDMRNMPDEERLWLIGKNILPIVELSSVELDPKEPIVSTDEVEGVFGSQVVQTTTLALDRTEGDTAYVSVTTIVPPDQADAMVDEMVNRYAPGQKAKVEQGEITGVETKATYEISLTTGLVSRLRTSSRAQANEDGVEQTYIETRTLELTP